MKITNTNSIALSNEEKEILRQLEYYKNFGGKFVFAVKNYGALPFFYTIYSETEDFRNRKFIANIYGDMVECLNKMFREEIQKEQTVFKIDDILKEVS